MNEDRMNYYDYHDDKLSIIAPKTTNDIVLEGSNQSNCVASYVDSVRDKKCVILSLRRTKMQEMSEVTLEIRGNKLVQAKSFANHSINKEHKEFLETCAKKKNIVLSY